MEQASSVSIIIPVHNGQKWLRTAIASALFQAPETPCEIIVIDDGSTDASPAIIAEYGDAIISVSQPNRGASAARNAGLARASNEYIKFLDADDYLLPGALAGQLEHAIRLGERTISFGRMFRQEEDGRILPHGTRDAQATINAPPRLDLLVLEIPVLPSILYPKSVLEQIGGLDERVGLMDDFDLFVRVLLAGYAFAGFDQPIYAYRNHTSTERLSARSSRHDFYSIIAMFERHVTELERGSKTLATAGIRAGLSSVIWIRARQAVRLRHKDLARELFALATRAAGRQRERGRLPYRALERLLGPIAAEEVLASAKAGWRIRG